MSARLCLMLLLGCIGCTMVPMRASGPAAARESRRLALLVGVGRYYQLQPGPGHRPWPQLHTAVEIDEYRQVLIRSYGFAERDVLVLLDEQATKTTIRKAFQEHLIEQAQPGDVVLFHFSGHGQHLSDDSDPARRDEPDGLDESLVTYDALDQSVSEGATKNIRDDEVGQWLTDLTLRMRPGAGAPLVGNITVTLDVCFSGSATRGALIARGRTWDVSRDGPRPALQPQLPAEGAARILDSRGVVQRELTVVAAARADQTAWERDGRGVFTRHWVRLLAQATKTHTYQAAVDRLAIDIAAEGLDQVPQVEGAAEKLIFSGLAAAARQPEQPLRVLRERDGTLWLQEGEVHGVTLGSEYRLHSPGAVTPSQNAGLGQAKVVQLSAFKARLEPLDAPLLTGQSGALATETHHAYHLNPLQVILVGFDHASELREQLSQLDIIHIASRNSYPDVTAVAHDLVLRYQPVQRTIELLRPAADLPHAAVSLDDDAFGALTQRLVAEWRRAHFASLRHPNPAARVDLELIAVEPHFDDSGKLAGYRSALTPPPAAQLELPQHKAFALRLRSHAARDLFAAVLAISPDGDIDVLLGKNQPGKNRIRAGETMEPPLDQVSFSLVGKPGEKIIIKVIATADFVDFSGVESTSPSAMTRGSQVVPSSATYAPLQRLLDGIGAGVRSAMTLPGTMEWGTTDASVTIAPTPSAAPFRSK